MRTASNAAGVAVESTPLPAAASRGVSRLLEGPQMPGVLLGISSNVAWLGLRGHVIVLTGSDPARLPNGIALAGRADALPNTGDPCVVGEGCLKLGATEIDVVRWWDPHPTLHSVTSEALAASTERAGRMLQCDPCEGLASALGAADAAAVRRSMREMLGKGKGLTPEGDDVLVGVLAGLRLMGPAVGVPEADEMLKVTAPIVHVEAPFRTTALSVALLRHAYAGEVAGPVAGLLQALTGRGDLATAVAELQTLGASSGTAMGCGVLLAARSLLKGDRG